MKVLVFAAHPDDEVLGCGGTIARHIVAKDSVHVVILAEGLTSRSEQRDRGAHGDELGRLAEAARSANTILGTTSLVLEQFPDNRLDSIDRLDLIKTVERYVNEYKPEVIYTHHSGDVNVDHRRVHEAAVTACRPMPGQIVKRLLFFEVPSSTDWQASGSAPLFVPNWYVDISDTLERKMASLRAYASEMRDWPHSRSLRALETLARWRGASVGCQAAEAFMLGRAIT